MPCQVQCGQLSEESIILIEGNIMGFAGISVAQLLILLFIVVLLFGTKRLRSLGSDLGAGVASFKKGMQDETQEPTKDKLERQ